MLKRFIRKQLGNYAMENISSPPIPPRTKIPNHTHKGQAPLPPTSKRALVISEASATPKCKDNNMNQYGDGCGPVSHSVGLVLSHDQPAVHSSRLRPMLYFDLVDHVRNQTNISYKKSKQAVDSVITMLAYNISSLEDFMVDILEQGQKKPPCDFSCNEDAIKLRELLEELETFKGDSSYQHSYIDEEEPIIKRNLEHLADLLKNANPELCKSVLADDSCAAIYKLVEFYELELRLRMRLLLLEVFKTLCQLDARFISKLLVSELPTELVRDMQADFQEGKKFIPACALMTILLSLGQPLPASSSSHVNEEFLTFLFELVERQPEWDTEDELRDEITRLILAINLSCALPSDNVVMKALAEHRTAITFLEIVLFLVNRKEDPVQFLPHEPQPPNSVLKFLMDMFSQPTTANLMFPNDTRVLIEIVLRYILDLPWDNKMRVEYLTLMHLIIKNSDYREHRHRQKDLQKAFIDIYQDQNHDGEVTEMNKLIVKQIWDDFPDLFPYNQL